MGKKREFDPAEQVEAIVKFIQNYFVENGNPNTKAIIGISGGKDSTIAAALCVKALGKNNVLTVAMPCSSFAQDLEDAKLVADTFNAHKIQNAMKKSLFFILKMP